MRPVHLLALIVLFVGVSDASAQRAAPQLDDMATIATEALAASRAAAEATDLEVLKANVDDVFAAIWGVRAGVRGRGGVAVPGWKERWQVDGSEFDEGFVERYGSQAPTVQDPRELGLLGRGRALRKGLRTIAYDSTLAVERRSAATDVLAALNNVIGWMLMDDGVTKGERQPRVDLTRQWDAPVDFWNSTADTGWLFEAYAQASNILKTDYAGDLALAQSHAADLGRILERVLAGTDADRDGVVEPAMMEGGLRIALERASAAGL